MLLLHNVSSYPQIDRNKKHATTCSVFGKLSNAIVILSCLFAWIRLFAELVAYLPPPRIVLP